MLDVVLEIVMSTVEFAIKKIIVQQKNWIKITQFDMQYKFMKSSIAVQINVVSSQFEHILINYK